jgi:hypothetical protein
VRAPWTSRQRLGRGWLLRCGRRPGAGGLSHLEAAAPEEESQS